MSPRAKRLKQLEDENAKLKKIVADLSLDREMLQEVSAEKCKAWSQARAGETICGDWGVSIRRACRVLEFDTSTYHYSSRRPEQAGLEARIQEICATRVRYGYRRVQVLLCREGWDIN